MEIPTATKCHHHRRHNRSLLARSRRFQHYYYYYNIIAVFCCYLLSSVIVQQQPVSNTCSNNNNGILNHQQSTRQISFFVNAQVTTSAEQHGAQADGAGAAAGAQPKDGTAAAAGGDAKPQTPPRPPVGLFERLDLNHDSMLSVDEYNNGWPLIVDEFPSSTNVLSWFFPSLNKGGFWKGFTSGVAMILATEIGDKTFFIAAVLSMRQQRSAVFLGAILSLYVMTVLSSIMGLVLPKLIPVAYTHILGGVLFLYFGVKLLCDAKGMESNQVSEELEEVEEELLHPKKDEESQEVVPSSTKSMKQGFSQVAMQSFTLTFLAEWGDRSQIATIALSAAKNPYGVTLGGCVGHTMCTGLAVLGGRMLAARISEKTVNIGGGIIFLVFGIHSVFFES